MQSFEISLSQPNKKLLYRQKIIHEIVEYGVAWCFGLNANFVGKNGENETKTTTTTIINV